MNPRPIKRIALFDLDHTLLPIDSDYEWGNFTTILGWTDAAQFSRRNNAFYADYQQGTLDIHDYVRFATEATRLQGLQAALQGRAQFMQTVIEPALREPARQLLARHREQGDLLAIITATNEFVTQPIAQALGVPHLLAVQLARDEHDWITGEIVGVPTFKDGKVTRMLEWLAQQGLERATVHLTFYSDSINDLPLLEQADTPVATNPDQRLRPVAQARGWRILELFPHD
jgi:HAD superfamily hydrolase (TIGR01490 family)